MEILYSWYVREWDDKNWLNGSMGEQKGTEQIRNRYRVALSVNLVC